MQSPEHLEEKTHPAELALPFLAAAWPCLFFCAPLLPCTALQEENNRGALHLTGACAPFSAPTPPSPPNPCPPTPRSNYKNDTMIRKECYVSQAVLDELKRIIEESEVRGGAPLPLPFVFYSPSSRAGTHDTDWG